MLDDEDYQDRAQVATQRLEQPGRSSAFGRRRLVRLESAPSPGYERACREVA